MADNPNPLPDQVYISSHMRADTGYGDTANLQPSSLLPGDKIKYSPTAAKLRPVAPVNAKAAVVANETRKVSAEPFPVRVGRRDRAQAPAKIPSGNNRAVSQIAPRKAAKR